MQSNINGTQYTVFEDGGEERPITKEEFLEKWKTSDEKHVGGESKAGDTK